MSFGEVHEIGQLPETYCVPRWGGVVRETVRSRGALRTLRAELELLRRVNKLRGTRTFQPDPATAGRVSQEDRDELAAIIRDAGQPIINSMIQLVDQEFAALREELIMSAINNEAERLCQEAADAGVLDSAKVGAQAQAAVESIDEALASVTAELDAADSAVVTAIERAAAVIGEAAANGGAGETDASDTEAAPAGEMALPDGVADEPMAQADQQPGDPSAIAEVESTTDMTQAAAAFEEHITALEAALGEAREDQAAPPTLAAAHEPAVEAIETLSEPVAEQPQAEPPTPQVAAADRPSAPDTPVTAASAQGAVREIEAGIRRLAEVLSGEVNERWSEARRRLEEMTSMHEEAVITHRSVQTLLAEIRQLRDECDTARTESRQFREDTRRAKQRSEASAEAAEHAADQARTESALVHA